MIRQAVTTDFNSIRKIQESLILDTTHISNQVTRVSIAMRGFLVGSIYTHDSFHADIHKTFLVYERTRRVVGYLRVDEKQEIHVSTDTNWYVPDLKNAYFSFPHATMGALAVLPEYQNHHIGNELLATAVDNLKKSNRSSLYSCVVVSPITNIASLLFHERNGFQRVGVTYHKKLFGLLNYQSFLYRLNL